MMIATEHGSMKISIINQILPPATLMMQGYLRSLHPTDASPRDTTNHDSFGILQIVAVTDHLSPGPALVDFPSTVSEK